MNEEMIRQLLRALERLTTAIEAGPHQTSNAVQGVREVLGNQSSLYAVADHGHVAADVSDLLSEATPAAIGTAAAGTSGSAAHADHAHAITDGTLTAAKLADAVADLIVSASATPAAENADNIDVTVQVKDAQGNALAAEFLCEVWLADTATGWESGTAADALTVQTGVAADIPTAAKRLRFITNASGLAVIRVNKAGAQTWYLRVAVCGKVHTSTQLSFSA